MANGQTAGVGAASPDSRMATSDTGRGRIGRVHPVRETGADAAFSARPQESFYSARGSE